MKLTVCISVLLFGHALGYYLPVNYGLNEFAGESCACSGKHQEYDYRAESQPEEAAENVKYKFDFEVEQPKAPENADQEPKSYNYQIQMPPSEIEPENTKYKFDYTLQAPAEEKPVEKPERIMYTKVDRMTQDKPECSCKPGNPCTCGYSPEQYAAEKTDRNAPYNYNAGYVLPVQYDNHGDFVVYEFPEQQVYSNRRTRQVLSPDSARAPLHERISALINSDHMKAASEAIRQGLSRLTDRGEERVGSSLDVSAVKDHFSTIADKIGSHATDIVSHIKGITQQFSGAQRSKRDVSGQEERRIDDRRMPMLRVEEYTEPLSDKSRLSKYSSNSRVELKAAENREWNSEEAEKAKLCHKCGTKLTDSVCTRCGEYQPQYIEYIEGKPVSYYPRATQQKKNEQYSEAPRYVYDRYGHRYIESNGNLRLIAPQHQEAIVGDQPNFAGLADILNQNQEVIHALNQHPGRLLPEPVDLVEDGIQIIRGLARRDVEQYRVAAKRPETALPTRTMYQVVPMSQDGRDGKLVVKVYSAKNDKSKLEERKLADDRRDEASQSDADANMTEKSKPTIKKFTKNHRDYEVISFNDYNGNSEEDIRQVLDYIHGQKS